MPVFLDTTILFANVRSSPMFRYTEPFCLSTTGSTRATAYRFSNKAITHEGKTHVVWLDAVATVCARTFDHAADSWSETWRLFDGSDNHTSPAITLGTDGFIRMAYGPHGFSFSWNQARFKHVRGVAPNRVDAWGGERNFGYNATYPSLQHLPCGLDAILYRGGEAPWACIFQRQREQGGWTQPVFLAQEPIAPQYTFMGAWLATTADNTLYAGFEFYMEKRANRLGAMVLRSTDLGHTWYHLDGARADLPVTYDPQRAVPHPPNGQNFGINVDSRGRLWTFSTAADTARDAWLGCWDGGRWERVNLAGHYPAELAMDYAAMTLDTRDRIHIAATLRDPYLAPDESPESFAHPSDEMYHFCTADEGASFHVKQLSSPDPSTPNWLPSISIHGPTQPVEHPVILWTHGAKGVGNTTEETSDVYVVRVLPA